MRGVSSRSERGKTQTGVKAPKCRLSVKLKGRPRPQTAGRWAQKQPSFKQRVKADPSRVRAPKICGAKPAAETSGQPKFSRLIR